MSTRIRKLPFFDLYLLKKVLKAKKEGLMAIINTYSRRSTIIPEFVGMKFGVYNGKKFLPVAVNVSMVGRKLGEFSPTRTFYSHVDKKVRK